MKPLRVLAILCLLTSCAPTESLPQQQKASEPEQFPIIDMHLHALPPTFAGELGALHPRAGLPALTTEAAIMKATLEAMERNNVVLAIASGPLDIVARWRAEAPDRILTAPKFPVFGPWPNLDGLRADHQRGELHAIGEITAEYAGLPADAVELEPYYALAEELDIPVAIHLGQGPPEAILMQCCLNFSLEAGSPLRLEPVLQRHRKLRLYVNHMARPFVDEMLAIMSVYPRVYVDISGVNTGPREAFREYVLTFLRNGMGNRLMFGSDQMIWPSLIDLAVEAVVSADFLTEEQKQDILYNNAARFLRLSEEEIAKHHGR